MTQAGWCKFYEFVAIGVKYVQPSNRLAMLVLCGEALASGRRHGWRRGHRCCQGGGCLSKAEGHDLQGRTGFVYGSFAVC